MNAVLRIFVWLLALSVVALPVVAVLNGWVGAERWPLAKLRVHGEFKRVPAEQLQRGLRVVQLDRNLAFVVQAVLLHQSKLAALPSLQ